MLHARHADQRNATFVKARAAGEADFGRPRTISDDLGRSRTISDDLGSPVPPQALATGEAYMRDTKALLLRLQPANEQLIRS